MNKTPSNDIASTRPAKRRGLVLVVLIIWSLLLVGVAYNRRFINDQLQLLFYDPPASIAQLARQDLMTDKARTIFYVNQPQIVSKHSFNNYCENKGEQTVVLGCYHGDQQGIFLLSVTDERLYGVEQVTAAHELLHAAYDRLNGADRQRVDSLLNRYYAQVKDKQLLDKIDIYKKSEPGSVMSEMHSIFGTEVANLPVELEEHYAAYFKDRKVVVNYAQDYRQEFTSRQQKVKQADADLAQLKKEIDTLRSSVQAGESELQQQLKQLDIARAQKDYQRYNAMVAEYNDRVNNYNNSVRLLKDLINRYNMMVEARNAVALEEQQLMQELSSDNVLPARQQ